VEDVAANRRLGNRPLVAMARGDLAGVLAVRAGAGDLARAAALLERAIADATSMGMMGRAAAWQARLPALRTHARPAADDGSRATATGATGPTGARRGTIYRAGARWVVTLDGREARVANLLGMSYLAELLARPGREVPALTLASRSGEFTDHARYDLLDDEARATYTARAQDLSDDLAEAEANNDVGRAERLRAELDALVDELTAATGLNHRSRAFADNAERARVAVRKAIKRAIDAVDDAAPAIAEVLRATVTTGAACAYTPDPSATVTWSTRPPPSADTDADIPSPASPASRS
jgi:hypothetical protein